ncbi:hypothetical protein GIB67_033444 [Kingdonia uniflora]|uniref:Uncharacterized protein n=1 Tax=Kingdonia uniflora TaxID=39325 RepID=A0A7J7LTW3_9MAGN|nr:hypothetical protein GIB67_033444 [Kingdonia uniflora]
MIRSIRLVTETYIIAIQINLLSEGRLLSQSIQSGRDAPYSYSIFKDVSVRSLIDMLNSTYD